MEKEEFYDSISNFYDEMIDFDKALIRRKELLAEFLSHDIAKANFYWRKLYAADLGCATGIDSIALSQLGIDVTSFDISGEMLKKAKANAEKFRIKLKTVKTDLAEIESDLDDNFNLIISSSNTPANIPFDQIQIVLDNFYRILKPAGKFIIQLLNYDKMLKERTETFAKSAAGDTEITRGYTYGEDGMQFNVKKNEEFSSTIYPHRKNELEKYLLNSGFIKLEFFGGLNNSPFDIETSKDLVITGIKP